MGKGKSRILGTWHLNMRLGTNELRTKKLYSIHRNLPFVGFLLK